MLHHKIAKVAFVLVMVLVLALSLACKAPATPATTPAPTVTVTAPPATVTVTATPLPKITMKWQDQYTPTMLQWPLHESYVKLVEKYTDGGLKFDMFPSGALVPMAQLYDGLKAGILDAGLYNPGLQYELSEPLANAMFLGLLMDTKVAEKWLLEGGGKEWYYAEYAKLGLKPLMWFTALGANQFVSSKKITQLSQLKGLIGRVEGKGIPNLIYEELGITGHNLAAAEVYEAFQRGVIDTALYSLVSYYGRKQHEVAPNILYVKPGPTGWRSAVSYVIPMAMTLDKFNKLPKEYQDALMRANDEHLSLYLAQFQKDIDTTVTKLKAEGATLVEMSAADETTLFSVLDRAWAKLATNEALRRYKEIGDAAIKKWGG